MKHIMILFLLVALSFAGCGRTPVATEDQPTPEAAVSSDAVNSFVVPDTLDEAIGTVVGFIHKGEFQDGLELANESLKKYPDSHGLLINRGTIYFQLEQYESAESDYTKVLETAPQDSRWMILTQRARCARELGRIGGAEEDFSAALEALVDSPDPAPALVEQLWRHRGHNFFDDVRYKESIESYTEALKFEGENRAESLMMRAWAYSNLGDEGNHQKDLAALEEINPEAAQALGAQIEESALTNGDETANDLALAGTLKLREGSFEEAIELLDRSLELDPELGAAYLKRGSAYQNLKNYPQAIKDYTSAYDLNADEAPLFNRAICYLNINEFEKAKSDLQEFLKISKSPTEIEKAKNLLQILNS